MKIFYKKLLFLSLFLSSFIVAGFAMAQTDLGLNYAANLGLESAVGTDPRALIVNIVKYFLTFLGIIAVAIIMYAGWLWMTSNGNPDKIAKAKKALTSAIIGLIIILSAFMIVVFISRFVNDAISPSCNAVCPTGEKCCQGSPDYCCANAEICCNRGGANECCAAGEYCCAGIGCSVTPCSTLGPPAPLTLNSTVPQDTSVNVIRNVRLRFNFNLNINPLTVDTASVEVSDSGGQVSGDLTVNGKRVIFEPDVGTCPANPCNAERCFAAGETINVSIHDLISNSGQALTQMTDPFTGLPMMCGTAANPCTISFDVGDLIDCEDPVVGLDITQVCVSANNPIDAWAQDDAGVADIELIVDNPPPYAVNVNGAAANPFYTTFNWDGSGYTAGTPVTFTARANDYDAHTGSRSITTILRPAHCCDGALNADETGVDCGGSECAACDGAACGASLNDDCDLDEDGTPDIDCTLNNTRCSSNFCDCDMSGPDCQAVGYATGIDDCCLCQRPPTIDWVTPFGGFCRNVDDTPTNDPCQSDSDCTTGYCDMDTGNGAVGNLITIIGRNFGATPGTVQMDGIGATHIIPGCPNTWANNQVIVQVPAGVSPAITNVVVRLVAANGYEDTTGFDARGPVLEFLINTIVRPGLCGITPDTASLDAVIDYVGINLGGSSAFFGNISSNIAAIDMGLFGATTGQAGVPNLQNGQTSTFNLNGIINSNYLTFTKVAETPPGPAINSFDPVNGAPGQYVTISGTGFGASQGSSQVFFGTDEADYSFPAICADSVWGDNQVIVKVPSISAGPYIISMDLGASTIDTSALTPPDFTVNTTVRPNLCKIQPIIGPNNSNISLWGEDFGPPLPAGLVRFHSGVDQTITTFWGVEADAERIDTTISGAAISGPVKVVQGGEESNGLDLTIGLCTAASNPDAACGTWFCCPENTFREGRCVADPDDPINGCDLALSSSVYEWDFSTEDLSYAGWHDPCQAPLSAICTDMTLPICDPSLDLFCDETQSCICEFNSNSDDSCQARALRLGTCEPYFCPNSPGECSPYAGQDIVVDTCDQTCAGVAGCTAGCTYASDRDQCVLNSLVCTKTIQDIFNNNVIARCQDSTGELRWHFATPASCPAGWTRTTNNRCQEDGAGGLCQLCPSGFSCQDHDNNGDGACLSNEQLCPGAPVCNAANECIEIDNGTCECCCEIGQDARDCCWPLTCEGECGDDRIIDTDTYGYCSGCANTPDPDAACNCEGHSGKFCDLSVPNGVCRDCAGLDTTDCQAHSNVCCLDAMAGDQCRGGDGDLLIGGVCAYFNCDAVQPWLCASSTPIATGTYSSINICSSDCVATYGNNGGESCYSPTLGDCSLPCTSGYNCLGVSGCFGAGCSAYDSTCRCCCTPGAGDNCNLISPQLVCEPNLSPCSGTARGLCCGCSVDTDCGLPATGAGCGQDSCCRARPDITSTMPADDETLVCRNAAMIADFSQPLDTGSLTGNVLVVGEYDEPCPAGTQFLAAADFKPVNKNIAIRYITKIWFGVKNLIGRIWSHDTAYAYVNPQTNMNYCAITGGATGYNDASGNGVMEFRSNRLLDGNRRYYVIIKGDSNLDSSNGVLNQWGIGLNSSDNPLQSPSLGNNTFNGINYINAYIWTFTTMDDQGPGQGVCEIGNVRVRPSSYLFQTTTEDANEMDNVPTDPSFDTRADKDKVFVAQARSQNNQVLTPVLGYAWDWVWSSDLPTVADITNETGWPAGERRQLVEADSGASDANTYIRAAINLTDSTYSTVGDGVVGTARVYVFLCSNPWPPVVAGAWSPWIDNSGNCTIGTGSCYDTHFELYYCRDEGQFGPYDDLPALVSSSSGQVIRRQEGEILKEAFFPRAASPIGTTTLNVANTGIGHEVDVDWPHITTDPLIVGYRLYWGLTPGNYNDFATVYNDGSDNHENVGPCAGANSFACLVLSLSNNRTYYFNLTSFYQSGVESDYFGEVSVDVADTVAPATPTLAPITVGDSELTLSWSPIPDADSYIILYGVSSGYPYGWSQNIGSDTSVIVSGLTNGTTYYFIVRAVDNYDNESPDSNEEDAAPN